MYSNTAAFTLDYLI